MKKIFLLVLVFSFVTFAQNNQSIELPDFVITGSKNVSIPEVKKNLPEVDPNYSDLQIEESTAISDIPKLKLSEPVLIDDQADSVAVFKKGKLTIGAGFYTQPVGKFFMSTSIEHVRFNINAEGVNSGDFIENSRYNKSSVNGGLYFYISPKSVVFPGAKIVFKGKYSKEAYRLYGSLASLQKRENDFSGTQIIFDNTYSNYLNYGVDFSTNKIEMKIDKLEQINVNVQPRVVLKFNSFKIFANVSLRTDKIYSANSEYASYQKISGGAEFYLVKSLIMKFGIDYYNLKNQTHIKPFFDTGYRINEYFSISGKFMPFINILTHQDYLSFNKFYDTNSPNRINENHKYFTELLMQFEFPKTIQVGISFNYDKIDSLAYFSTTSADKNYYFNSISNIHKIGTKLNLLMSLESFGNFYFELMWQSLFNKSKVYIPYHPDLEGRLIYSKKLAEKFDISNSVYFADGIYREINSRVKLPVKIGAGLKVDYHLFENFNLFVNIENLLNKKYYEFEYYQTKPLDIMFGFDYQW